jgi:lipoprotein-anchoring transpeptidase ErfK/SrfK
MKKIIKLTESELVEIVKKVSNQKIIMNEQEFFNKIKKKISGLFTDDETSSKNLKASNWSELYSKLVQTKKIKNGEPLLIVWGPSQSLYYTSNGKTTILSSKVSTGANGFGNSEDDKKTPTGLMKVTKKIQGKNYEVLVHKSPTGKILGPNIDSNRIDDKTGDAHHAEVLTGILELSGLENENSNVFYRNIYFHGTNKEGKLGIPASNGCIRTSTPIIKSLLQIVPVGTKVYIYN